MKMIALMNDMRKMPMYRQVIPQEAGIGWPIPLRRNKHVYVIMPCFGYAHTPDKHETTLYPPFATITLDWSKQVPVEYVDLRFRHPWLEGNWEQVAGTFPHAAVKELSVQQYQNLRNELLIMYDALLDTLGKQETLSAEWKTAFSLLLRTMMEPPLEPYYRALGEKFFQTFLPPLVA
jgi:hypothetical protein